MREKESVWIAEGRPGINLVFFLFVKNSSKITFGFIGFGSNYIKLKPRKALILRGSLLSVRSGADDAMFRE